MHIWHFSDVYNVSILFICFFVFVSFSLYFIANPVQKMKYLFDAIFAKFDADNSGTISKTEFDTVRDNVTEQGAILWIINEVQAFDSDGDGEISKEEWVKFYSGMLEAQGEPSEAEVAYGMEAFGITEEEITAAEAADAAASA